MSNPHFTRRQWLAGMSALGMQSLTFAKSESATTADGYIDAHVHLWTSDQTKYPRSGPNRDSEYQPATFTAEDLFANAKPCGVKRVVLIQMSFFGFDNSYMLDAISKYKGSFTGVAVVDDASPNVCQEMRRLGGLGVRGFRIVSGTQPQNWLDSSGMSAMWKCAAENSQAMCLLVDPEALPSVGRMCAQFPGTTVVIDHLGRIGMSGPIRDPDVAALCGLARHKRVHVKVSAFYALGEKKYPYLDLGQMIRRLRDAYGASRLMWGSDSPFQEQNGNAYAGSIELVRDRLDFLTANDRLWMLRKTAEKVFFQKS
jgi:predicted TIM-barrel fold metal-dependent hydrolase